MLYCALRTPAMRIAIPRSRYDTEHIHAAQVAVNKSVATINDHVYLLRHLFINVFNDIYQPEKYASDTWPLILRSNACVMQVRAQYTAHRCAARAAKGLRLPAGYLGEIWRDIRRGDHRPRPHVYQQGGMPVLQAPIQLTTHNMFDRLTQSVAPSDRYHNRSAALRLREGMPRATLPA